MKAKKILIFVVALAILLSIGCFTTFAESTTLGTSYIATDTTYDLADGETLTVTGPVKVQNSGSLTINGGNVTVSDLNYDWAFYAAGGDIVFNNVNLTATSLNKYLLTAEYGHSITFNNCTITLKDSYSLFYQEYGTSGVLNLNNTKVYLPSGCNRVANGTNAVVNLTNGSLIDADGLEEHAFRNVDITVENSTIDVNGCETCIKNTDGSNVTVTGCSTIAAANATASPAINLSGGSVIYATSSANITIDNIAYENVTLLQTPVAKIGDVEYTDLQAAIDAAQNGDTITLLDNVVITEAAYGQNALNYAKAVDCTIDLNSYTLSADTGNSVFRFNISEANATSDVTVTLKNGKVISGANTWCAVMACGASADIKAIFNLENLIIENSKGYDFGVKAWENSIINAKKVTINATSQAGGFYAVGGEIILDDCTVNQTGLYTAPYTSMAFAVASNGKLTVNSGSYTTTPSAAEEGNGQGSTHGSWCGGVMNSGGSLIINGGSFANGNYGDDNLAIAARGLLVVDTGAYLEINGGTFKALKSIIDICNNLGDASKNPTGTITGGTFSTDPTNNYVTIAEGYEVSANEDGTYGVVQAKKLPTINVLIQNMPQGTTTNENGETVTTYRAGCFAAIDSTAYSALGIEVKADGGKVTGSATTEYLYTYINVTNSEGTVQKILPTQLGETNKYIFGRIMAFTENYTDFSFRPFAVSLDGKTTLYGDWSKEYTVDPQ